MADIERGRGLGDERLPWLEAVEDDDARGGPGAGRLVVALLVALVAIGLVVGGIFWLRDRQRGGADGAGDLIVAPQGPYKTRPDEPGGMKVEGQGETAYAASEGRETNAGIDLNALPEAPVAGNGVAAATGPAPAAPVAPAGVTTATAPVEAVTGGMIQLGAFSSEAKANAAWKSLATRFVFLAPLTTAVQPVKAGSGTLYRLRAVAGAQADAICGRLKVAGETCARIGS